MGWPIKQLYGINVDPSLVGPRQVPANPASKAANPPIQVYKHARNGHPPDAWLINALCEATNQGILYRTKEVFHNSGIIGTLGGDIPSSTAGDRVRWRWAFHTGPYSRALMINMIMHPQNSGLNANSAGRVDIYSDAICTVLVGSATFNYGVGPGGSTVVHGLSYLKTSQQMIEGLSPDTDYYGVATDVTNGRMVSCSVAEIQSMTENFSGYMPQNVTAESSIIDTYRELMSDALYNLWRRGASTLFNFTIEEPGGVSFAGWNGVSCSATPTNILNNATTYGAAVPGYTLNLTGCARLSQMTTGVPIRFCAYVVVPAANTGVVTLRDSAGAAIVTLTQAGAYTGWVTGTGVLPVGSSKYYITHHRSAGAGTVQTDAVSCYQYE
jgi:hypothetical protein